MTPARPPLLLRALNAGGRAIERAGLRPFRLDEGALLRAARRRTGLEDFGGEAFREPLRILLGSYEREAKLSLIGRIAAWKDTLRILENRLRLEEDRKRHPEIAAQRIERPLFILGLPRAGTTLLHRLLAQDPALRAPAGWEVLHPSPPPEPADRGGCPRLERAERQMRWIRRLSPGFEAIHPIGASIPQECHLIQSHSFLSYQFQTTHRVPSYQSWLERQDLRPSYEAHRRFLQHLQLRCPWKRWVLKAPTHIFSLRPLLQVYPGAAFVFTHRDPAEVVASLASLVTALRRIFSDSVDPLTVGRELLDRWARGLEGALEELDREPDLSGRIFHARYEDLARDPIGLMDRLSAHLGLPFTAEAEAGMRRFLEQNPKDKRGTHRYSLEEFGLRREEVEERFRFYRERFDL